MTRTALILASLAGIWMFASACGGTGLLGPASRATTAASRGPSAYLGLLAAEQSKLAAAERQIPRRARTPAQFSKAISQLAAAVRTLARDLEAIRPPASVSSAHAQLIAIVRAYASALADAARRAAHVGGELAAARTLLSATGAASRAFGATVTRIERVLAR
jgi:hypothetical protein